MNNTLDDRINKLFPEHLEGWKQGNSPDNFGWHLIQDESYKHWAEVCYFQMNGDDTFGKIGWNREGTNEVRRYAHHLDIDHFLNNALHMKQLIRDMQARIKGLEIQTGAYKSLLKSMEESEPSYRKSYHKAVMEIEKLTSKASSVDSEREMNIALTAENLRLEEENAALREKGSK